MEWITAHWQAILQAAAAVVVSLFGVVKAGKGLVDIFRKE